MLTILSAEHVTASMSLPASFSCTGYTGPLASPVQAVLSYAPHLSREVSGLYLSNIVRPVDLSRSRAGHTIFFNNELRDAAAIRTKCGEPAFSHAGPVAQNALPEDMRAVSDSVLFRKRLKTHLFSLAFNVC